MPDLKLLNQTIKEKKISKSFIARSIGKSRVATYQKLNGGIPITLDEAKVLKEIMQMSNELYLKIFT